MKRLKVGVLNKWKDGLLGKKKRKMKEKERRKLVIVGYRLPLSTTIKKNELSSLFIEKVPKKVPGYLPKRPGYLLPLVWVRVRVSKNG